LWSATALKPANAGFTLIEVLVALSIVALGLTSIGALVASTARGTRSIETHLTRLEIARAVMTAIPDRDQTMPTNLSGDIAGYPWRVEASPFVSDPIRPQARTPWVPHKVVVSVRSPTGGTMQISTIRLQRGSGG
jgi:general secretion pathway protein I